MHFLFDKLKVYSTLSNMEHYSVMLKEGGAVKAAMPCYPYIFWVQQHIRTRTLSHVRVYGKSKMPPLTGSGYVINISHFGYSDSFGVQQHVRTCMNTFLRTSELSINYRWPSLTGSGYVIMYISDIRHDSNPRLPHISRFSIMPELSMNTLTSQG